MQVNNTGDQLSPLRQHQQESKSAYETQTKAIRSTQKAFAIAAGSAQLESKRQPPEAKRPISPPPLRERAKAIVPPVSTAAKRPAPSTFASIIAAICNLFSRCWPWSNPSSPLSTFRAGTAKREPQILHKQLEGSQNLTTIFGNKALNVPSAALRDLCTGQHAVEFTVGFPQDQVKYQPAKYAIGEDFQAAQHAAIIDFHDELYSHVKTLTDVGRDDLWFKNFIALHTPAALAHEQTQLETHFKAPLGVRVMQHAIGELPFSVAVEFEKDKITSRTTVIYEVYDRRSNQSRGYVVTSVNRTIPWEVLSEKKPSREDLANISYSVTHSPVIKERQKALEQYSRIAPGTVRIDEQLKLKTADRRARKEMAEALPGIIQEAIAKRPATLVAFEATPIDLYHRYMNTQANAAQTPLREFSSSIGRGTDLIVRDGERIYKTPPRTYDDRPGKSDKEKTAWIAKVHRGLVLFFLNSVNMNPVDHENLINDEGLYNTFTQTPEVQGMLKELDASRWIPLIESAAAADTLIVSTNEIETALKNKGLELSKNRPESQKIEPQLHRGKYLPVEVTLRRYPEGAVQGFDYQVKGNFDLVTKNDLQVVETIAEPVANITAGATMELDDAGQPVVKNARIGIESPYVASSQKFKLMDELQSVPSTEHLRGESLERITSSDGTRSLLIPHTVRVDLNRATNTRRVVTFPQNKGIVQCAFVMPKKGKETIEDAIIKFYDTLCKSMPPEVARKLDVQPQAELNPWFNNMLFLHTQGGWANDLQSAFEKYPDHSIQNLNLHGTRFAQTTSIDHQIHIDESGMTSKATKIWPLAKRENTEEVDAYVVSSVQRTIPLGALSKAREQLQSEESEGIDNFAGGQYQIEHSKLFKNLGEAFKEFHSRMAAGKMIEEILANFPTIYQEMVDVWLPISLSEGEEQIRFEINEKSEKAVAPVLERESVRGINFQIIDGDKQMRSEALTGNRRTSQAMANEMSAFIKPGDEKWERVLQCLVSSAMALSIGRAVETSPEFNLEAAELTTKYNQPNVLAIAVPKGKLPLARIILHRIASDPQTIERIDVNMDVVFKLLENPGRGGETLAVIHPEAVVGHLEARAQFKDGKLVFEIDREKTTLRSPLLDNID